MRICSGRSSWKSSSASLTATSVSATPLRSASVGAEQQSGLAHPRADQWAVSGEVTERAVRIHHPARGSELGADAGAYRAAQRLPGDGLDDRERAGGGGRTRPTR